MTQHDLRCESGGCILSDGILSTPKQVFVLRDVDHVECRRPLMAFLLPVVAGFGAIGIRFADILHFNELALMVGLPSAGLMIAREVGVLKIHSLSLRGERVWGSLKEDGNDPAARGTTLIKRLAQLAVLEWDGVGGDDGKALPVTPEGIFALMDLWPIAEAFERLYLGPALLLEQEKNV